MLDFFALSRTPPMLTFLLPATRHCSLFAPLLLIVTDEILIPEEGHRTRGFQISGDGKCISQKKATKEKAILFVEAIINSTIW
jgi:hypothetical protein